MSWLSLRSRAHKNTFAEGGEPWVKSPARTHRADAASSRVPKGREGENTRERDFYHPADGRTRRPQSGRPAGAPRHRPPERDHRRPGAPQRLSHRGHSRGQPAPTLRREAARIQSGESPRGGGPARRRGAPGATPARPRRAARTWVAIRS